MLLEPISGLISRAGVSSGETVLIHSAFRRFAGSGYDVDQVLEDLCDYFFNGNLMLPTMSWRDVNPENPFFEELNTPSITGYLSELFRLKYASSRSLHPTHSVAGIGNQLDELLGGHHLDDTPCSPRSPFGKLVEADGTVILLGTEINRCTLVHFVEEMLEPSIYLKSRDHAEAYQCSDRFGQTKIVKLRRHLRLKRNFWKFGDMLAELDKLTFTYVQEIPIQIFKSKDLVDVVSRVIQQNRHGTLALPGEPWSW